LTIYSYKKKINYDGYFKNNQGREFSLKELSKQENYMYGQFKFISKFCLLIRMIGYLKLEQVLGPL
jgi:hypothetical protein